MYTTRFLKVDDGAKFVIKSFSRMLGGRYLFKELN